jgi:hypothetical protein
MKKIVTLICILSAVVCLFGAQPAYAEYVLPYPSYMPGNTLYRVSRIIDTMKNYWYWGTIAQIKYHIGLSDKYLVEAKTLFEYMQYLLATDALQRSDTELSGLPALIERGIREGKDMSGQQSSLSDAMRVHGTTLESMKKQLPSEFQWTPEKTAATDLPIGSMLDTSISLRQALFSKLQGSK